MKRHIIISLLLSVIFSGVSFAANPGETTKDVPALKGDGIYTIAEKRVASDFDGTLLAIDKLSDIPNKDGKYERYSYYEESEDAKNDESTIPPYMLDINVGMSALELGYGEVYPLDYPLIVTTGVNTLFDFEDYILLRGNICLGNETIPGITLKIGFEGLLGRSEEEDNLGSFGILVSAAYDQRSNSGIPFEFSLQFGLAPGTLCFFDLDEYMEFEATLGLHIFTGERRGTIYLGYRYINIGFDEDDTDDLSDSTPILGFKYRF